MKFIRHPEFNLMLEPVLKALEVLNSSDNNKGNYILVDSKLPS